eukprot:CAMPEP_0115872752 /NCGR_PEP_ID=MMETSP0287-20121206/23600_1 /TAXON_ID=412157 /ORGANISM="Chrysochromulina rotalis, Strain UIO044" /LENGTH=206 /DNA_ID=CAMNT_0003327707 /DNA_START=556 /DNA_END=1176 /DNA_ORIENTATION=+
MAGCEALGCPTDLVYALRTRITQKLRVTLDAKSGHHRFMQPLEVGMLWTTANILLAHDFSHSAVCLRGNLQLPWGWLIAINLPDNIKYEMEHGTKKRIALRLWRPGFVHAIIACRRAFASRATSWTVGCRGINVFDCMPRKLHTLGAARWTGVVMRLGRIHRVVGHKRLLVWIYRSAMLIVLRYCSIEISGKLLLMILVLLCCPTM